MNVIIQLGILVIGFALLVKGADWFVDGASGVATKLGIPQLVIGLTIVAMGTSAPEAAVSISAALKGSADITIGNIVGSNILNILIILGLAAVIVTLHVAKSTVKYEMPFVIIVTALLMVLGLDGTISLIDGIIFLVFFVIFLGYLFRLSKNPEGEEAPEEHHKITSLPKALVLVLVGLVMIVLGSDLAVDAASEMARIFGMSERFIGLTIVALGTSLPELVTSVSAAKKGNADIAIGNIVGSNIFNILFVVGISALIVPVPFSQAFMPDMLVAIGTAALLWILCLTRKKIDRVGGHPHARLLRIIFQLDLPINCIFVLTIYMQ